MQKLFQLLKVSLFAISFSSLPNLLKAEEIKLGLPVDCTINKDCFIQNLPDIIKGKGQSDSFCKGATYDEHKGVDIRLLSLKDINREVPVIASAPGTVRGIRDGEEDKLVLTREDRKKIKNKECGNGVVLSHKDGFETQYCHLKKGSIQVKRGEQVNKGDRLGFIGNSGFAAFPHMHLTLRKGNQWLDPVTGNPPSKSCSVSDLENSFFDQEIAKLFTQNNTRLMTSGITGDVINHNALAQSGAPEGLAIKDEKIVGWAWFINLRKGDQIYMELEGPEGLIAKNTTKPITRHKADFSTFTGKKAIPQKGEYQLKTELLRNGKTIEQSLYVHIVE